MALSFQDKIKPVVQAGNSVVQESNPVPVPVQPAAASFIQKATPVNQNIAPIEPQPKSGFFDKFKKDIVTPVAGAALGLTKSGRTIQGLMGKGVDKVFGTKGFGAPGTVDEAARTMGLDPESSQFKTGAFVGEAGSYMMPGSSAAKLTQGSGILAKSLVSGVTDATTQAVNAGKVDGETLKTGLISAATTGLFSTVGKILAKSGEAIQNSVIKPSQADINDGFSIDTVQKYDLGGSLNTTHQKTEDLMNTITQERNAKLGASDTQINLREIFKKTSDRLQGDRLKTFGTNSGVSSALDGLKNEIRTVGNKVSIPDADIVKRASGEYGAWTFGRPDADSAKQAVYNVFYNELKKAIEDASPEGVRELNRQLSELIPVRNAVIRRIPIAERNLPLSLTDIIALSSSVANPSALGVLGVTRAQKSGAFGNMLFKGGSAINNKSVQTGVGAGFLSNQLLNQSNNQ